MDKLQMCRICLAENVHMYVVVNDTLHDLYEKLTDNPFVTEDSRPILACFICCAQLKKCYRLMRKCLDAEEQFAKMIMIKEEYEIKPLINQDQFELFHGFIRTPIDTICIVDVDQTENIVVKEELPAVCERLDDFIELNEERESDDDLKTVNKYDNYLDIKDIPLHHCESDSEDDVPLMKVKTEVDDQEVSKMEQETDRILVAKKRKVETTKAETMTAEQKEIDTKIIEENQDRPRVKNNINTTKDNECLMKSKGEVSVVKEFKLYKCDVCHKSFRRKCLLVDHLLIHIGSKPFKCDICQRSFRSKLYLRQHIIVKHSSEKPFKCNVCGREYSNKPTLTQHYRKHTGEKPFKCDVCGCELCDKQTLTRHNLIHTGEKPLKCNLCQYASRSLYNLKQHSLTHTGDKAFKCDKCLSSFGSQALLTRHMKVNHMHTSEKPFKCDICGCEFSIKSAFTRHYLKHTGEKPFKCNVCGCKFADKTSLIRHNRNHTGEKPYQCKICQYKSSTKYNLKVHNRLCTHDNPFKCDECPSSFRFKCRLRRHKKIHHKKIHHKKIHHPVNTIKEPYKCNICPYECYSINYFVEHSRLHIGQNPYHWSVMTHHNQVHTGEISSNTVIAGNSQLMFTQLDSTQSVAYLVPGTQLLDSVPKEAVSEYSVKMCEN